MLNDNFISDIAAKISASVPLTREEGVALYQDGELGELGYLAQKMRQKHNPGDVVTYLIDRNINYTNVCNSDCSFCGFYRHDPKDPEAYVNSREVISEKIEEALELGATRILLQGGHNDDLSYDYYVELVDWINSNYDIEINSFSPSEIHQMHLVSGKDYETILRDLKDVGMSSLPGGGAEILDDDVRRRVSPKKIGTDIWIEVMEIAHGLGLTTTSTMVIGFGETIEQRLNHFDQLRDLQTKSNKAGRDGFNAFIAWPLQHNENTSMGRSRHSDNYGTSGMEYLRNTAVARLYLDNIPHHQGSWPTMGPEIGKVALHMGCDDFGSTMMEENVVSSAGALTQSQWCMSPEELRSHIEDAGYLPAQRDTNYNVIQQFDRCA